MMTFQRQRPERGEADRRRGSVLVFLVAGVVLLLAMTMISVDVASMQLARTELRAATDAAAKAGAEALLRTQSNAQAVQAAVAMASLNTVAGSAFKIAGSDVVIGTSAQQSDGTWAFSAGGDRPNAVRVNSKMSSGSASGPVRLAFGKMFNSGTFTPSRSSTASAIQQEICLAIDRSASMSWDLSGVNKKFPPNGAYARRPQPGSRWHALRAAFDAYLQEVAETAVPSRVALVTWASDMPSSMIPQEDLFGLLTPLTQALASIVARLEAALSYNFGTMLTRMNQLGEHPIYGGTNMSAGIDKAVETLTAGNVLPYASRSIVLMTDGQWNEGRDPRLAAADARAKGIMIHVVTFLPGAQSADARAVASITGGTYIHANDQAELIAAFEKLARTLPVVLTD
ncbi:von Willebrand factor type A domain protein [Caulifigura coniformis]|uniref:von Willebrand factor type A domain protein n=1 Tax=Caulifigura coniformis TaxID=2527983 RepID=A0A517S7E6_9PLAN|nr:vWA domain-containing protein [Caulifigura coniformis]QDT52046.1 von Willebrand factor type A domain protein [Caulifigura coniformis]